MSKQRQLTDTTNEFNFYQTKSSFRLIYQEQNMKHFSRVIALTAIFAIPAFAQDGHQHDNEKTAGAMGMHDQQMATMHDQQMADRKSVV